MFYFSNIVKARSFSKNFPLKKLCCGQGVLPPLIDHDLEKFNKFGSSKRVVAKRA
jgi:hypothetical protein